MKVSVEILDRIFSFLIQDKDTLVACSKVPLFTGIAEKYLYYHLVVLFGKRPVPDPDKFQLAFEPDALSELISKNPHILRYVRILQVDLYARSHQRGSEKPLAEFAKTMLMFPALECIMLTTPKDPVWFWPDAFRAALEDRLNLPTLTELHLVFGDDTPVSLFSSCKNIKKLSLSGVLVRKLSGFTMPRLESLAISTIFVSVSAVTPILSQVKSLKCSAFSTMMASGLFGACRESLKHLTLDFGGSPYVTKYTFRSKEVVQNAISMSPTHNLERLAIYTTVDIYEDDTHTPQSYVSYLPVAAAAIKSLSLTTQHLILDVDIGLDNFSNLMQLDLSPLAVLGLAALSIPRIDLYVHTDVLPAPLTRAQLFSSLEDYEDVLRAIKEGVLVIHSERTAPDYF